MKYYPNNWQAIKDAPSEYFPQMDFEEFIDWRVHGWEIPSSVMCIFRAKNTKTGKIKEHVYKDKKCALKKIQEYMENEDHELVYADHQSIHLICTKPNDDSSND